jgi:uncharacterized protein with GYD domain
MAPFVITGNYTAQAMKGMIASPSDREAAARAVVEAAGGKMHLFLLTTGESDFLLIAETESIHTMIGALMVVGSTGAVTNLRTAQAFTAAEFMTAAKDAARIAAGAYRPAG